MIRNEADTNVLQRGTMDVPNRKAETGGRSSMTHQKQSDRPECRLYPGTPPAF